jgi:amidase
MRYKAFEPVLTVDCGETVLVETINHMTPVVRDVNDLHAHGSKGYREREETGPIFVRGAKVGDMLSVKIEAIEVVGLPHAHGSGPFPDRFPQKPLGFAIEGGRCQMPGGLSIALAPMIGDIYTTPAELPAKFYDHGGNMDFTEIKPGNTLYLPVLREGGLLVLGDVHAVQGDGEMSGEGAECAADVTVTLSVNTRLLHPRPIVETPSSLICLACRGGFHESARQAVEDATALLARLSGVSGSDAYVSVTLAGSLRIAGCVFYNGKNVERALVGIELPKDLLQ